MRFRSTLLAAAMLVLAGQGDPVAAQAFRRAGVEFNAMRPVNLAPGKSYAVIVTEFYHHGQIAPDGRNVVVALKNQNLVPSRVLQLGPGDFCRLAFQTVPGQTSYEIFYGGDAPAQAAVPEWTNQDGLLLETRVYKDCNLNSLDSVRQAFASSTRIGSDYVPNVLHAGNPFTLKVGPFLSRYSGRLHIPAPGTYGFLTSSQDCSFLLIDDKLVVDAPGQHRPAYVALRGSRKDISLSAGPHQFEYYHAAAGNEAIMAAAWEVNPPDVKPKPVAIPSELFRTDAIGRATAEAPTTRAARLVPDFLVNIAGSVPLPDNDIPLVGVQCSDASPKALTMKAKILWEFGDGQTGEGLNPVHVYLRPGVYRLKLTLKHGVKPFEMAHRVYIDQPKVTDQTKFHNLDEYLPILKGYEPRALDALALRQLVLAYQAKAERLQPPDPDDAPDESAKPAPDRKGMDLAPGTLRAEQRAAARAEMFQYIALAVEAGKVAFLEDTAAQGDEDLMSLARLLAPMARDLQGDSSLAYQIWQGAARRITRPQLRAQCAVEAADIAVNDLLDAPRAKKLLDAAAQWAKEKPPPSETPPQPKEDAAETGFFADVKPVAEPPKADPRPSNLARIWGDYYAATGDGKAARKAYVDAERIVNAGRNQAEQIAWRGAHARSTEQFLRTGELDRAVAQIRVWQQEFPVEKIDGQLTSMYARYWAARQKYPQAIALAEQLLAVNADSPYIDQVLLLAAVCEVRRDKVDRAIATLEDLAKKYPGSPYVSKDPNKPGGPDVPEAIKLLRAGQVEEALQRLRDEATSGLMPAEPRKPGARTRPTPKEKAR